MSRGVQAIIHLSAIQHNYQLAQGAAASSQLVPIIKANAYGHGSIEVAKALYQAPMFGVACLEEALELRQGGIEQDLLLLEGFFHRDEIEEIQAIKAIPMLHSLHQIKQLSQMTIRKPLSVWLKVNTGMNRLGLQAEELEMAMASLSKMDNVKVAVLASHFACADNVHSNYSLKQLEKFKQISKPYNLALSMANSAGILAWPNAHFEWVRPGIMLYGATPFCRGQAADHQLKPVMEFNAKLIAIHQAKQGDAIGYGRSWVCPESMPIGVVGVGYGDGYPRVVPNGTPVWLNNTEVPIVGRVSMDMMCLDLRRQSQAKIGDTVQLWGDKIAIDRIANAAQTISYELSCGITRRVPYEYRKVGHAS